MSDDNLKVSEIFQSLQGEGVSAGCPCLFIRLATCNLKCRWCDTRYSWDFVNHDYAREVREFSPELLAEKVLASGERRLVLTGGEPLIQQQRLALLLQQLPHELLVEVETNGTLMPQTELLQRVDQWNVSPKLSNSGEPATRRLRFEVLASLQATQRAWLKLVVGSDQDFVEAEALIQTSGWPRDRVLLMPLAQDRQQLRDINPSVVRACGKLGYRYSPRLHLELFNGARAH